MFKLRNLLALGVAVATMFLMASGAVAQPAQQDTATPEATPAPTDTPVATVAVTDTATVEATSVAPAVSPLATPIGTPGTLPTTGDSDTGTAALSLLLVVAGVVILLSILGVAMARRSQ